MNRAAHPAEMKGGTTGGAERNKAARAKGGPTPKQSGAGWRGGLKGDIITNNGQITKPGGGQGGAGTEEEENQKREKPERSTRGAGEDRGKILRRAARAEGGTSVWDAGKMVVKRGVWETHGPRGSRQRRRKPPWHGPGLRGTERQALGRGGGRH